MLKPAMSLLFSIISLFLIHTTAVAGDFMSADEVKSALSGKTCNGEHLIKDLSFKVFFSSDGNVRQVKGNGSERNAEWSVRDNGKRCLEWEGSGVQKCFPVKDNGNNTYTLTKVKGNGNLKEIVLWSNCADGDTI